MHKAPLSKVKVESKLAVIREALAEISKIVARCTEEEFVEDKVKFALTEHYLRRALEAVFDIAGHIISRFPYSPGRRPKTMRELAEALGTRGIVDAAFASGVLSKMAGYRNRMVHFYEEITPAELYGIATKNVGDLEKFAAAAVSAVDEPQRFDLSVEE